MSAMNEELHALRTEICKLGLQLKVYRKLARILGSYPEVTIEGEVFLTFPKSRLKDDGMSDIEWLKREDKNVN